nr:MAG TPA: hypothetical protein [Caudoviricetes sp.]
MPVRAPRIGERRAQGPHFTKDNMKNNKTVTVCHGLKMPLCT